MTDISEQSPAADQTNAAGTTATTTRAKRASLNTMLLSELQQLAGGMGIATAKLKKSDLVAAIKTAQGGESGSAAKAKSPKADAGAKTEARTEAKTDAKTDAKSDSKHDTKSDTKSDNKSDAKSDNRRTNTDVEPKTEQPDRQRNNQNGATQNGTRTATEQPARPA